jgi:excisionase family DNA binding protein
MKRRKSDGWLSVAEAADALGISRVALYKAIKAGRLKARPIVVSRRTLRVSSRSLKDFEKARSRKTGGIRRRRSS